MPAGFNRDWRKIRHGYDGELHSSEGKFLGEVPSFQVRFNFRNQTYNPAGDMRELELMQRYGVTISITESVIDDSEFLKKVIDDLAAGRQPAITLRGRMRGDDPDDRSKDGLYLWPDCVPTGQQDWVNSTGDRPQERAWSFHVNGKVQVLLYLTQN